MLDVGALFGQLVMKLNRLGINAEGMENDPKHFSERLTDKVFLGTFDENYTSTKRYDLICFTQMIYYVKNPEAVILHASKMLNENGMIFIHTHNPESKYFKSHQIMEKRMTRLLTKKDYESLDLKLIDYTIYRSDIYLARYEAYESNTQFNELVNYVKFYYSKAYHKDPEGHHAFILLGKK